nr:RNA-directed DNA polymerase, eukaryota [Tanacetum cinerariifolium]
MPPRRRVVQDGADDVALDALRRQNADLQRQVELLTERMNEFANVHRHDDDVTVTDENPFSDLRDRSPERPANRWEQSFKVEIPTFYGSLKPEEFIDWLYQVDEILDFKRVPDDRRNLRQGTRSVDDYSTDFYAFLARIDLNESTTQLVSRYIGGLRLQLQNVLNMFDPLTVAEAHQCALQAEKQLNRSVPGDTKLLSAPVSNKIEAYRLFRRNVPVTTLASGPVPARPTAYTLAGALFLPPWLPCAPLIVSIIGICHTLTVTCKMANFVVVVALRSTWTVVVTDIIKREKIQAKLSTKQKAWKSQKSTPTKSKSPSQTSQKKYNFNDYSVDGGENNSHQIKGLDHVSESSCMKQNDEFKNQGNVNKQGAQSADPFGNYEILNRNQDKEELKEDSKGEGPTFPPGFTLIYVNDKRSGNNRSFKLKSGGSILEVIEDLVEIRQTMRYNMEGCLKNIEAIVGFQALWGNFSYDFAYSHSLTFSGGILCVWDLNMFSKDNVTISDSFLAVRGTWIPSSIKLMIVSAYAPQDLSEKKTLWEYITHMIDLWEGECVILGDFNEVRLNHESFGTIFNDSGAKTFNHFISSTGLIDVPLEGYSYTWALKSALKMSKVDRFFIFEGLLSGFPSLSALCLDRHLSDHRPNIMREFLVDYGPSPFRVFHSWFDKDGFDKLVEDSWKNLSFVEANKISLLWNKFQALKAIDKLFDKGKSNDVLVNERTSLLKDLHDINAHHSLDMAQKAKIRWSIEGDENSKYFHGVINKKRSQLSIRGVIVGTDWIDEPTKVENEFLNHFSNRFSKPSSPDITLDTQCLSKFLSIRVRSWKVVYWKIIDQDVVDAVHEFFVSSKFSPRSNSSFITLIPKKQDAKVAGFKKAFDSVRWDYLDGILSNFGFGAKWRGWIQGCLNSAMGSILVNGSPSSKFKFYKGLKQGDPLSPFLFILVKESLHISFNNILNAVSFKGIRIDDHLTLSHIFYADDAVFIGKWNKENVITIVYMLKCFFLASRLKINIHKSKLMGIGTTQEEVNSAANIIGCNTFSTPFNYFGVKVGTSNSRSRSQETSLWSRFIKAVYGDQGSLVNPGSVARSSPWINITQELGSLSLKGIDLFSQMKKKVGNGAHTLFSKDS